MSHDPWGGGSDADPKLRKRELDDLGRRIERATTRRRWWPTIPEIIARTQVRPRFSVFDALLLIVLLLAILIGLGALR